MKKSHTERKPPIPPGNRNRVPCSIRQKKFLFNQNYPVKIKQCAMNGYSVSLSKKKKFSNNYYDHHNYSQNEEKDQRRNKSHKTNFQSQTYSTEKSYLTDDECYTKKNDMSYSSALNADVIERAANKLNDIILHSSERKKKRNASNNSAYERGVLELAADKLQGIIEKKAPISRTSSMVRRKENKYLSILTQKEKVDKLKQLEKLMNRRSATIDNDSRRDVDIKEDLSINNSTVSNTPQLRKTTAVISGISSVGKMQSILNIREVKQIAKDVKSEIFKKKQSQEAKVRMITLSPAKEPVKIKQSSRNSEAKSKNSLEFFFSLKDASVAQKTDKLPKEVLEHILALKTRVTVEGALERNYNSSRSENDIKAPRLLQTNLEREFSNLAQWGRMDITKEISIAESNVAEIHSKLSDDSIKYDITSVLNTLTVDNYQEVLAKLVSMLTTEETQAKFIEVVLVKSLREKFYVALYAKLAKDLNDALYKDSSESNNFFRTTLIDKCKETFLRKANEDDFYKMKQSLIGNVVLISELIKIKIISQKIGFYCADSLLSRYKSSSNKVEKAIYLEALIVLVTHFGKVIFELKKEKNIDLINSFIDNNLAPIKDDPSADIPSHVRYKIINLITKRDEGWKETLYEKASTAKGSLASKVEENREEKEEGNLVSLLRGDLKKWIEFYESEDGKEKKGGVVLSNAYDWSAIDKALSANPISVIISEFIEISIDDVNSKNLAAANSYIMNILDYYCELLTPKQVEDLKVSFTNTLLNINDLIMDNVLIIDLIGHIMFILINKKIIVMKDLNAFANENLGEDFYENIMKICKVVCNVFPKHYRRYVNDFKQGKIFILYQDIYKRVFK